MPYLRQAGTSSRSARRSIRLYSFCAVMNGFRCSLVVTQCASTACHEDMLDVVYANFVPVYGRPKRPADPVTVALRHIKHVDSVSELELQGTSNASDNGPAVSRRCRLCRRS